MYFVCCRSERSFKILEKRFTNVFILNNLLHCHTGVLARVYIYFLRWASVWRALNRCLEHQCICRWVRYAVVFDISIHICIHEECRVCTCARSSIVALTLKTRVGRLIYSTESACCLAWGVFLIKEEMGVFSVFCLFFDAGGSVCGYKCVYTHTHTYCTWGTRVPHMI